VISEKTLFLLRHGRTGFSGRYIGSRDVDLSPEGSQQIKDLRNSIKPELFDAVYASPLLRCRQSCDILFPDSTVQYKDALREIDFGRWEGLTFEEIRQQDSESVNSWAEDPGNFTFPEGESVPDFSKRIEKVARFLSKEQGQRLMLVCHGGVIRGLLCYFLGIDYKNALLFQVKKGSYTTIELFGERGVLSGFNLQ